MNELECNHQCLKFGSLSRIADLRENPFIIRAVPRKEWDGGDYVVGRYLGSKSSNNIDCLELCDGTLHTLQNNDVVVGALGERCATQEVVGTWKLIDHSPHPGECMHVYIVLCFSYMSYTTLHFFLKLCTISVGQACLGSKHLGQVVINSRQVRI